MAELDQAKTELAAEIATQDAAVAAAIVAGVAERDAVVVAVSDQQAAAATARDEAALEISATEAAALAELNAALDSAWTDLTNLLQQLDAEKETDQADQSNRLASHIAVANAELADLNLGLEREKYWDETVQAKIDDTLDYIELRLVVASLVPGLGTATSVVLTAISLWRGHYFSAALSAVGAVPGAGSVVNAMRATKLGAKAATRLAKATSALSRAAQAAATTGKELLYAEKLAGGLGAKVAYGTYDLVFCKALRLACFTSGTPIQGEFGPKPIETFRDYETYGDDCDRVLSRNEFDPDGPLTLRRVLRRFIRQALILELKLEGGAAIGTTSEHPFYRRDDGWVHAGVLRPGDEVQLMTAGWVRVEAVIDTGRYEVVYNLEVEDDHTYFVGAAEWGFSVWAHNACVGPLTEVDKARLVTLGKDPNGYVRVLHRDPVTGDIYHHSAGCFPSDRIVIRRGTP